MTAPAVRVEPMRPEHGPAVLAIFAEGIATGHATFEVEVPTWEDFDAAKLPTHRFVATEDGASSRRPLPGAGGTSRELCEWGTSGQRVLGWVAASPTSPREVYRGVVEDALYVTAEARGRGVGRALLDALVRSTDDAGIWTITSGIFPENTVSLALHESFGFRRVGTRERIGLMRTGPLAGTWRDVVWMERRTP